MEKLLFSLLVVATVVPAFLVAVTLNIVRAACWLLLSLCGAAGLFFLLGADFVGATQLLIYVGGTLVLLIFGVMLTATGPFVNLATRSGDWVLSIFAGGALFGLLAFCIGGHDWRAAPSDGAAQPATANQIGLAFLGLLPRPEPSGSPTSSRLHEMNHDRPASRVIAPPHVGYLLPFEIVSVHLVVVLIGAAYLSRAKQRRTREAQA